jgi:hypothetical protein
MDEIGFFLLDVCFVTKQLYCRQQCIATTHLPLSLLWPPAFPAGHALPALSFLSFRFSTDKSEATCIFLCCPHCQCTDIELFTPLPTALQFLTAASIIHSRQQAAAVLYTTVIIIIIIMAFEQPLEADQIDLESSDFNIFSAFVRVPLLILGGVLGGGGGSSSSNNADGDDDKENSDDASFSSSITPSVHRLISNIDEDDDDDDDDDDGDPRTSGVLKDLTSMNIHDDDERFFDCNGSSSSSCSMSTATTVRVFSDETMEQQQQQQLNGNFKHDDNDGNRNNLVVVTKKMSWSDESGLRLVQYNDEVSRITVVSIQPLRVASRCVVYEWMFIVLSFRY